LGGGLHVRAFSSERLEHHRKRNVDITTNGMILLSFSHSVCCGVGVAFGGGTKGSDEERSTWSGGWS